MLQPASESDLGLVSQHGEDPLGSQDLHQHLLTLRRRLPLVAGIALACTALATLRTLNLPAVYASTARVQLAKEAPDPTRAKQAFYWEGVQQQYLNTQIENLRSMSLALDVIRDARNGIARELEADLSTADPTALAAVFRSGVKIMPVKDTYLVEITYESTDAERCARYANALSEAYRDQLLRQWGEKGVMAERQLSEQADLVYKKLTQSEERLRSFLDSKDVPLMDKHIDIVMARIDVNNKALQKIVQERNRLDAMLEENARVLKYGRALETAPGTTDSLIVRDLAQRLALAEVDIIQLETQYLPNWPRLKAAKAQRDLLRNMLEAEVKKIKERLESEREAKIAEEKGLLDLKQKLQEEARVLAGRQRTYDHLREQVKDHAQLHKEFVKKLEDLAHYGRINISSVQVVDPAGGAYRVRPHYTRDVLVGLLFGLLMGVGAALLVERLADRLRTLPEAVATLNLPALGVVPEVTEVGGPKLDLYALENSRSPYAESFRRARVQLEAVGAFPREGCGVLLCTSGVPREGKTLCVINLAVASALAGRRTLLIDADMRNPRTHKVFELPLAPGLGEFLATHTLVPDMIHKSNVPNLDILAAGSTEENPAELLARQDNFDELLEQLRPRYDRIIVDTPPVAAVSDGTLMAPAADATLLVVSAKSSSRSATLQARTELTRVGCEPIGMLFNQQGHGPGGYYYYRYSYGYTK